MSAQEAAGFDVTEIGQHPGAETQRVLFSSLFALTCVEQIILIALDRMTPDHGISAQDFAPRQQGKKKKAI